VKIRRGLTLVEALVTIAIFAVVILVLMEILFGGLRLYRHGVSREDLVQNARVILERIRSEMIPGGKRLLSSTHPLLISDEEHNVLQVLRDNDSVYFGCYRGRSLPSGEDVYILGRATDTGSVQPLTDGYDGGKDPYWVSVEMFKVVLLTAGNSFMYGLTPGSVASNKGVYIYLKLAGPGGVESKRFSKSKFFEVSTIIYLRE